ncbi:DNA polymerase III subunit alpha [Lipingzhangella sp. LS1_29]|uniref:DNA polymerase III subunit alpha n=1 Tax=Lipingzhangella rawalii TaxID=2055835 RepID=A0ABU2H3L3_9ACTN|nr:DNA polymerase III subunit alpha [Lipingzhangella rawalii]MDS1269194.1 DNA polymerase III subunit alpha [Lipingzhangella rawalii]
MSTGFAHLNVVSASSMRHGTSHPHVLADRAAELGMDTLALTDRDGVHGAVAHARACVQRGLRPVLGVNLAVAAPDGGRVTLLARGRRGWASLCRVVTAAHATGDTPGTPAIPAAGLAADGLILLLGPDSDVGRAVARGQPNRARRRLLHWRSLYPEAETLAVELVDHYGPDQRRNARAMLHLATETRTLAVLSNAVRYPHPDDVEVAHLLDEVRRWLPGGTGVTPRSAGSPADTGQAYLKSTDEMAALAERICGPDRDAVARLLAHTRALAESCVLDPAADLGLGHPHLPDIADAGLRLWQECTEGLTRRGLEHNDQAHHRLAQELSVIEHQGVCAYFPVIADITRRIRDRGIRTAIRGSGAGSLVNYLLGISEINPLERGLLMERFLTTNRTGLPDIDLDVESARRLEAYQVVFDAYGAPDDQGTYQRVACVSMPETYRARGALRDVGRALGIPPHDIDALARSFPHIRARQISSAVEDLPELRSAALDRYPMAELFRLAERLDGLPRHQAMHPCGIVVSDAQLPDRAPTQPSQSGYPMVQLDKTDVEAMGLIKLDVLGVRMQSAMAHAVAEVERTTGHRIDLDTRPGQDPATYALIRSARTLGCFQIESPGQRELVSRLRPASMDDLVVDISLFRPGPVNSDMITPFLAVRDNERPPLAPTRVLAEVLAETGGVIVFHEQVLAVLHTMTGCGLDTAEAMRRRMDTPDGREQVRRQVTTMAAECGHDPATIDQVWSLLESFGAFGFCKAHAAAFAVPTYQSAWLKRHHPAAFYAGVLTHDPGMYPKRALVQDARQFGVPLLGVDVNHSDRAWRVEPTTDPTDASQRRLGLRVPLGDVQGISDPEVQAVIAGRPYTSLADFTERAHIAHDVTERLVLLGGFDAVHGVGDHPSAPNRRDLLSWLGANRGRRGGPRRSGGQVPLTMLDSPPAGEFPRPTSSELRRVELAELGYEVESHIMREYTELCAHLYAHHGAVSARDLETCRPGAEVMVLGVKVATQTPAVRSGQRVIFTTLDDGSGLVDLTFFESVQEHCAATVFGSWLLAVRGRVTRRGTGISTLTATRAYDLAELDQLWREHGASKLHARLQQTPRASSLRSVGGTRVRHETGARVSPYADLDTGVQQAPRRLWYASPGSTGR